MKLVNWERSFHMPKIKPVSDLRNYNEVLRDISVGDPVFLTRNGRGRYVIIDIDEYERISEILKAAGDKDVKVTP